MIASEPCTFSPSSNLIPGTVRPPNSMRMPNTCEGGENSNSL